MRAFYDLRGHELTPGRCLGRGGEGAVYSLNERPRRAAKIYARRPADDTKRKLAAMISLGTPQLRSVAAWPEGLLLESRGGEVAGFLMPRVMGHRAIHDLYGPASRKKHFPQATWAFLVRAARNLAAAFDTVHQHGLVVGDVNQGNASVSPKALVRLIDCDSFQVARKGTVWPCPVGVSQFTPPELQGQRFDAVARTREHDAFGLAVLVFHLLFMGRHPFAGRYAGREVPIEEAIRQGLFAFGWDGAAQGSAPPPHSLRLTDLPPEPRALFEQALRRGLGPRPTPRQWVHALDALEASLVACEEDETHSHAGASGGCPWCRIEEEGGPPFFGLGLALRPGAGFDVEAAWRAIDKVASPGPLPPLPSAPQGPRPRGRPLPPGMASRWERGGLLLVSVLGVVATVVAFGEQASGASGLVLYVLLALVIRPEKERDEQVRRGWAVARAKRELEARKARWERDDSETVFVEAKAELGRLRRRYESLDRGLESELRRLDSRREDFQLEHYLGRHTIDFCPVPGLDITNRRSLIHGGIWTAAEVSPRNLDEVWGLDPGLKLKLLRWRGDVEGSFTPDGTAAVPEEEIRAVHDRFRHWRDELEPRLLEGPAVLRRHRVAILEARRRMQDALIEAHRRLAQAKADMEKV